MRDHKPPGRAVEPSDIMAVRDAFLHVRDSDTLLGVDQIFDATLREVRRSVRRTLVTEALGFLEAREDLIDLQVQNHMDPSQLLDPDVDEWTR